MSASTVHSIYSAEKQSGGLASDPASATAAFTYYRSKVIHHLVDARQF